MKPHNQYYWDGKRQRAYTAQKWTEQMEAMHAKGIRESIARTKIYGDFTNFSERKGNAGSLFMEIFEGDSVSAVLKYAKSDKKTAVLNFASYKFPGGGFLAGSRAQEEALCHESYLYNVLSAFDTSYYARNREDMNRGLYRDKALYSPDILFLRDGLTKHCDVLTCAAPNFSVASRFVEKDKNDLVLRRRIRFVLSIAKNENVDTLILGAWGCGVFQQDPNTVAKEFVKIAEDVFKDLKIHIVFAVIPPLPNQTDNITPFVHAVNEWRGRASI